MKSSYFNYMQCLILIRKTRDRSMTRGDNNILWTEHQHLCYQRCAMARSYPVKWTKNRSLKPSYLCSSRCDADVCQRFAPNQRSQWIAWNSFMRLLNSTKHLFLHWLITICLLFMRPRISGVKFSQISLSGDASMKIVYSCQSKASTHFQ